MSVVEIVIDGEIGWDVTLSSVRQQFNAVENTTHINVKINSVGGDVDEGFAIHDFLRSHGLPVTTIGEGRVYSIATVILLAGDDGERLMYPNSQFMVHNPWAYVAGNANELETYTAELRRRETQLAQFYAAKTGQPEADIREWMNAETYLSAADTVTLGFANAIHEVIKASAIEPIKAVAKFKVINSKPDMSDQISVDRGVFNGLLSSISNILGSGKTAKAEAEPGIAEPEAVEKTADETKPDLSAQLEALTARLDAIEAEKAQKETELNEAKTAIEEKEQQLELAQAKVRELHTLSAVTAEDKVVNTQEKEQKDDSPFGHLAMALKKNRGLI